jgi:hypothetical protein
VSVAVTALPLWVTDALHAWVTVCPAENDQVSLHPLIGSPRLVTFTFAVNPELHCVLTV